MTQFIIIVNIILPKIMKGVDDMITALNVGNSILKRALAENIDITPMKLQKMVYFVYRDYLKTTNKSLFEERFETWKYGPVLPSIYNEFKGFGSNSIKRFATERDGKTVLIVNEQASPIFKRVLDNVWDICKAYDGIYLSSITHKEGSAWRKAVEKRSQYLLDEDIIEEDIAVA